MWMIRLSLMLAFAAFAFGVASDAAGRRRLIDATLRARSKRAFFSPRGRIRRGPRFATRRSSNDPSMQLQRSSAIIFADGGRAATIGEACRRQSGRTSHAESWRAETSAISWQNWKSMLCHWLAAERARSDKAMDVTHAFDRFRTQPRTRAGKGGEFFLFESPITH
jgi:hypothetical protein